MDPSSRSIKPNSLPPIERAAVFYAYWIYFRLQEWNTLVESTHWGWRVVDASLVPVLMDAEPVLDELLKIIRVA